MVELRKNLNKAPIKEVVIGISFDEVFHTIDDIQDFYDKSKFKHSYNLTEELRAVSFEVGEESKVTRNIAKGLSFSSDSNKENINIETNKLMYVDKNEYTTFDNFFNKFLTILNELLEYVKKPIKVRDIGLRYNNSFRLPFETLEHQFKIKSTMPVVENEEQYALYLNHLMMSNIRSMDNPDLLATIKTILKDSDGASLQVIFDIDVHLKNEYDLINLDDFKDKALQLKNYKNKIFFSNFENAYEIKEFQ